MSEIKDLCVVSIRRRCWVQKEFVEAGPSICKSARKCLCSCGLRLGILYALGGDEYRLLFLKRPRWSNGDRCLSSRFPALNRTCARVQRSGARTERAGFRDRIQRTRLGSIALQRQVIATAVNLRPPGGMNSQCRNATVSVGVRIDESERRCEFRDAATVTGNWKCFFNHGRIPGNGAGGESDGGH